MSSAAAAPPAELLLGRPEFAGDLEQAAGFVRGRRVLVTGAAGSVGWPLSTLLASADPGRLVLLDQHEYSLFSLERVLGSAAAFELADVRDSAALQRLMRQHAPEIVFHLAAAKHVPYGERFPEGAVATNVVATRSLLEQARVVGTEVFLYPSSDKSVQPPSVYGATKRLVEALVAYTARTAQKRFAVVRFVNIIGTRGSVIDNFSKWVSEGVPLRVTDERMTRYWMSMNEALWCLLIGAQCAQPGEVLMPACGEPVPIIDTARRLAGWYRPDEQPYPIQCTGIRPGERLHEILLSHTETFVEGPAVGLRGVRSARSAAVLDRLSTVVDELEVLAGAGDRTRLAAVCLQAAQALQ